MLTAALVIDYTRKERRRAEWDRQIALAQEEAERLRQRQLEAWSRIQRRSVSNGAWQQRRTLFTASESVQELDEETEKMMDPLGRQAEINTADKEAESDPDAEQGADVSIEDTVKKCERFSRLLATKLALEMMLMLRMGRSSRYRAKPTIDPSSTVYHQSMDFIVQELEKVLDLLRSLEIQKVPWTVQMPEEFVQKQRSMALQMTELVNKYRNMEIHLPDFVMSYVQLVTDFKIGLPNASYVEIMRVLSFHQFQSQLARHVEDVLLDSHQLLDCYTISNILFHQGTTADSSRFTQFLERLTRNDHHPRSRSTWYRLHVNDTEICVPKSKNGHVMTTLVRTALQCRQSTVAEAYAMVFIDHDRIEKYSGVHKWFILSNFLQSYGNWLSWESGRKYLRLAITWLSELATSEEHVMGRVVLRMLDFCVACGKYDDYEAIMRAVVAANMLIPRLTPGSKVKTSARMSAIRRDWITRIENTDRQQYTSLRPPRHEQAEIFASMLDGRWTHDSKSSGVTTQPPNTPWTEPGYLAFNPILAAKRLVEASEQRQETMNHQVKGSARIRRGHQLIDMPRPAFPPPGEQNALRNEPISEDVIPNIEELQFVSPYFNPVQQETFTSPQAPTPESKMTTNSLSDPTSLAVLEQELQRAEARLSEAQKLEKRRVRELQEMKRRLKSAKVGSAPAVKDKPSRPSKSSKSSKLSKPPKPLTPPTVHNHEEEDIPVRSSSASG